MTVHISPTTGCNLGCTYSAVEGTRVLTADLEWVPIESLDLDDEVLSFDRPKDTGKDKNQKLRVNEVTATYKYQSDAVRVQTTKGSVTVGATHPFLTKRHGFREAQDFKPGQPVRSVITPPEEEYKDTEAYRVGYVHGAFSGDGTIVRQGRTTIASVRCQDREVAETLLDFSPDRYSLYDAGTNTDGLHTVQTASPGAVDEVEVDLPVNEEFVENDDYVRGWLAGLFDTDGSFDGDAVRLNQYNGEVKEKAEQFVEHLGYDYAVEEKSVRIRDGKNGRLRFLADIQPKVSRKVQMYVGTGWKGTAEVVDIEHVGERVLYDVTVEDNHTLVMEGLCSHNCYENPEREMREEWVSKEYDVDAIIERLEQYKQKYPGETPGFHGGEPLLMKNEDMERLYQWIYDNYGEGGHIQTNGTMIGEFHIDIFKKYDVQVGISCDGPGELNKHRIAHEGGEDVTEKHTKKTNENIRRLAEEGVPVGIIVVLHEANAGTDERLERLLDWMSELAEVGVTGHYNPAIPYEDTQDDISLSPERLKEVYLRTWEWIKEEPFRTWNPMRDYVDNLLGLGLTNCVVNKCDVFNAGAAKIVTGTGETTGCGKTWGAAGDGGVFLQGESTGNEFGETEERYDMLKKTPGPEFIRDDNDDDLPDMGGCKGCKFWNVCQGGCPSSGMNFDYRNRTLWCEAVYATYEKIEQDLKTLLPNLTLVSDYPWDAKLADKTTTHEIDILPFAAMDASTEGPQSSYGNWDHPKKDLPSRVPKDVLGDISPKEWKKMYMAQGVEEESITVTSAGAHADSSRQQNQELPEGWEQGGVKLTAKQEELLNQVEDEQIRQDLREEFEKGAQAEAIELMSGGYHADSANIQQPNSSQKRKNQMRPVSEVDEIPAHVKEEVEDMVDSGVDPSIITVGASGYHTDSAISDSTGDGRQQRSAAPAQGDDGEGERVTSLEDVPQHLRDEVREILNEGGTLDDIRIEPGGYHADSSINNR